MGADDYLKNDDDGDGSSTYIEFKSNVDEQREAYRLCSRGGKIRERIDMEPFFADLIPHVADFLFESDPVPLMEFMGVSESDIEEYREEVLNDEEHDEE
jgi:hypothetical protein